MLISSIEKKYDVVVIGGGMVGSSFALALANATKSVSVLVIDAFELKGDQQPSFDDRSTALSYGSSQILANIGLWKQLKASASKIDSIQVSDKGHIGTTELNSQEYDVDALGYVVENRLFGKAIAAAMEKPSTVDYLAPVKVSKLTPKEFGMSVSLESDNSPYTVDASLVILADGGRSPLCSMLGIGRDVQDYEQHALITNVSFQQPHKNRAFERFTDTGPLAVLPLTDSIEGENRTSLVWTISSTQAEEFAALDQNQLKARLQERFGNRLGDIIKIGKTVSYPLSLVTAKEQIRPGLVLLGNAAHTLHPVAGQGFNLALRGAAALAAELSCAEEQGTQLGDMKVLQRFMDQQSKDQQHAILATDSLVKLFSNKSIPKSLLRKVGLISIDIMPSVKQGFAKQAMGIS
ncbi:MAG: 2-octaprenyl-6-methoxyphenyl hydroxylase [Pseudohongiellaceae bacterium]